MEDGRQNSWQSTYVEWKSMGGAAGQAMGMLRALELALLVGALCSIPPHDWPHFSTRSQHSCIQTLAPLYEY